MKPVNPGYLILAVIVDLLGERSPEKDCLCMCQTIDEYTSKQVVETSATIVPHQPGNLMLVHVVG